MKAFNLCTFVLAAFAAGGIDALATRSIQERAVTDEVAHGNYGSTDDGIWRYHEIADGLFVGVKPEEWDDKVHTRNITPLKRDVAEFEPVSAAVGSNLLDRDLTDQCIVSVTCFAHRQYRQVVTMYQAARAFFQRVRETRGENVMQALDRPFWANLAGVGLQNVMVTGMFKGGSSAAQPETCSTNNSQIDTFMGMVKRVDDKDSGVNSMSADIKLPNGSIATLTLALKENGQKPDNNCGAPALP